MQGFDRMTGTQWQKKLDNYKNMAGMIDDYEKLYSRLPTNKEFADGLGVGERSVNRYKKAILEKRTKLLVSTFNYKLNIHLEKAFETLDKNIKIFEKIRDESENNSEKMDAAKYVLECHLDAIRLIDEAPMYLEDTSNNNNDTSKNEHESDLRKAEAEKITNSIKTTFN